MKNFKMLFSIVLAIALTLFTLAGCKAEDTTDADNTADPSGSDSSGTDFSYSDCFDDNGLFKDITAADYVELCDYENITVPSEVQQVSDVDIQTQIDSLLSDYATKENVTDRAVADGDTVNIDYIGSVDGVEFDGGNTNGEGTEVTIGVTQYIDDFLEQLIGHKPGESFDVNVTFPDDYGVDNLNGKDAVFALTINYIVETVTPELTDSFVAENLSTEYSWTTVAEMKKDISDNLKNTAITNYLQQYVLDNSTITSLPESLLEYQENAMIAYYTQYASSYSMELDGFLNTYMGFENADEMLESYKSDNTDAANQSLVNQAIAEQAGLTVSEEDVTAYFKDFIGTEDYTEYEDYYGLPYLKFIVLSQKVTDYLNENATLA